MRPAHGVAQTMTLPYIPFYLALGALAMGVCLLLAPLCARLGHRTGMVDMPGGRRVHSGIIPRTGGLAIWGAFSLVLGLFLLLSRSPAVETAFWFPASQDVNEARRIGALLLGGSFCAAWGVADDKWHLGSRWQYLIQLGAALIAMAGLIFIKHVNNPLGEGLLLGPDGFPWWLVLPVTIFWFTGCMNTLNWLDGLNGLAAGVVAILCLVLIVHMLVVLPVPQASVATVPTILLGVLLGFLPFNLVRRNLFMGSSGSYFLGFAAAAIGIMGGAKIATVVMVLGLPIVDVAWLIFSRIRRGQAPWTAGRDHLHFVLLDRGIPENLIVGAYCLFCCCFGVLTLVLDDRLNKLIALIGLSAVAVALMAWLGRGYGIQEADDTPA